MDLINKKNQLIFLVNQKSRPALMLQKREINTLLYLFITNLRKTKLIIAF